MFLGRKPELQFLEGQYARQSGSLVVLYGRRRIGKTALLRTFCANRPHVFHVATELPEQMQLQAFGRQLLQAGLPQAKFLSAFQSWEQAFASMADVPGDSGGKAVVVIDEFPYMVKANPAIPSILQALWDSTLCNAPIMLVLCGSSMSFMEKKLLAEKNPLYGRATGILKMPHMPFADVRRFFPGWSAEDTVSAYAILGGTPHYARQFDPELPLRDNVIRNILAPGSILSSEIEFLMRQEMREVATYNALIMAIATGGTRLNELQQKTGLDSNRLSVYLRNLIDLGIVVRESSVLDTAKSQAGYARGLYRLDDNFFRFWFAFLFPHQAEIAAGGAALLWKLVIAPDLHRFAAPAFEEACRQFLRHERDRGVLPFVFTRMGRWWNKTDEIDILATNHVRDRYLIGECKFRNRPFGMADYRNLTGKFRAPSHGDKLYCCVFSLGGFTADVEEQAKRDGTRLYTAESLLADPDAQTELAPCT